MVFNNDNAWFEELSRENISNVYPWILRWPNPNAVTLVTSGVKVDFPAKKRHDATTVILKLSGIRAIMNNTGLSRLTNPRSIAVIEALMYRKMPFRQAR